MKKQFVTGLYISAAVITVILAKGCSEKRARVETPGGVNSEIAQRLADSAAVVQEVMGTPDKGIPQDLLDRAQCIVVVPALKKGAFIVGAQYGKGFISCRNSNGTGWSAPGAVAVEGGSVGFQIGGEETDVVMLLMNKGAQDKLLSGKFTVGADASVAAGPVGRTTSAQAGGANMTAELLSWSRSRGAFAGVSLQGATLRPDTQANQLLYGKELDNKQVIDGQMPVPPAAQQFVSVLSRYSSRQR